MTRNTLTDGLRNAVISFLLLIPYNFLAFAVLMLIGEGGFTPWLAVPAAVVGLGVLFLCGRYFLRELPSAIGTLLSLTALPLLYTGIAALICGKDFWYGLYPSFFLSSAALPISGFLNYDTPQALAFLSYTLGVLLPFAALYGGISFQPIRKQPQADAPSKQSFKNSAISFFSWLIAEAVCGALFFCGIYPLVAQGDPFEIILGLFFAAVLCLTPYIVPLICGKHFGKRTKNAATDALSCCIPFLLLAAARIFGALFIATVPTAQNNDASIFFRLSPTTFGFIYFIVPFLPGSEVVHGTMQSVIPDAVYEILPVLLPPIAYFIGMQSKRKHEKGEMKMCENTKKFLHNSAISVCGFILTNAIAQLVTDNVHSLFGGQIAAGTTLLFLCGGLMFVGYAVIRSLERRWQTALSLTVVPVLTILAAVCIASAITHTPYFLLLLSFSAELYFALIPEAEYSGNAFLFYSLVPFVPFLCITIGAAMRGRLKKGEM